MSTALAKIDDKTLAILDDVASHELVQATPDITKKFSTALQVAAQINRIRNVIDGTVMREVIRPLKDCGTLGFTTDENRQGAVPYNDDTIRSCVTEALLRGAQLVGNEFMIFQGKTFFSKAYFERKVRTYPGLTNLDIQCSTPKMMTGGALVEATAKFDLNGKHQIIERVGANAIAIRLQGSAGSDMAIGKCEKRMLRFILNFVTGYAPPAEPDDENEETKARVVEGVTVESNELVDDGPKAAAENPVKQTTPAATTPTPSTSGNEAAKAAVKTTRTVKPKTTAAAPAAAPIQLPPPPAAPVVEAVPEVVSDAAAEAPPVEEEFNQEEPGSNDGPTEEALSAPVIHETLGTVTKLAVAQKNQTTNKTEIVKAFVTLEDKTAIEILIHGEDQARSFGTVAKGNGQRVVVRYKTEDGVHTMTEFAAPPKK